MGVVGTVTVLFANLHCDAAPQVADSTKLMNKVKSIRITFTRELESHVKMSTSICISNDDGAHLIAAILLNNIGTLLHEQRRFLDAIQVYNEANKHRMLREVSMRKPNEERNQLSGMQIDGDEEESLLFHSDNMGKYVASLQQRYLLLLENRNTLPQSKTRMGAMPNDFIKPVQFFCCPCRINEATPRDESTQHDQKDDKGNHGGCVATLFNLAIAHRELGNMLQATELLKMALELSISSPPSSSTTIPVIAEPKGHMVHFFEENINTLICEEQSVPFSLPLMIIHNMAYLQLEDGQYQEALVGFSNAISRAINLFKSNSNEFFVGTTELRCESELMRYICDTLVCMTRVYMDLINSDASLQLFQETRLTIQQWKEYDTDGFQGCRLEKSPLALSLIVARSFHKMGLLTEALAIYTALLEPLQDLLPSNDTNRLIALAHHYKGTLFFEQGALQEAKVSLLQALRIKHKLYGQYSESAMATLFCIGKVLCAEDNLVDALTVFKRTLYIQQNCACEKVHMGILTTMVEIGHVFELQGELYKAAMVNEKVLSVSQRVLHGDHPFMMALWRNLERILRKTGSKLDPTQDLLDIIESLRCNTSLSQSAAAA